MAKFIVKVDKEKCIGCGSCAAICPGNFEMGEDGKSSVLKEEIDELGCNQVAAESCPVQAITVTPTE
jgi:ferredoxin